MGKIATQLFSLFFALAMGVACNVTTTSETTTSTDDSDLNGNSNRQMNGQNSSGDGEGSRRKKTTDTDGEDKQEKSPVDITGMYMACSSVPDSQWGFKTSCRFNSAEDKVYRGPIAKIEDVKIIDGNVLYDLENLYVTLDNVYERFSFNSLFEEPKLSLFLYKDSLVMQPTKIESTVYPTGNKFYMYSIPIPSGLFEGAESVRNQCQFNIISNNPFQIEESEAHPIIPPFGTLQVQLAGRTFYNFKREILAVFPQDLLLVPEQMQLAGHVYNSLGDFSADPTYQHVITGFEPNGDASSEDCSSWSTIDENITHLGRAGNTAGTGTWYGNDGTTLNSDGEPFDVTVDCAASAQFICIVPIVD